MCRGVLMWSIGRPRFKINRKGFTRTFFFLKALSPSFLSQSLEYARFGGLRGTKREVQDYHVPMCKFDLIFSPAFAVYYLSIYIVCSLRMSHYATDSRSFIQSLSSCYNVCMSAVHVFLPRVPSNTCVPSTCSFQHMFVCLWHTYIHTCVY